MSKILPIIQLGNPVLRKKATEINDVHDENIQQLIDDLVATVKNSSGVGIAAPQIGKAYRLFIISSEPNERYPNAPKMEPIAIINPKIISHSDKKIKDWEGCLSVPGVRGLVPRYQAVKASYTTQDGKQEEKEFIDFIARIFQHEYDHLDGLVFLDRLKSVKDIVMEQEYQKLIK
jgi:peptide deformylase